MNAAARTVPALTTLSRAAQALVLRAAREGVAAVRKGDGNAAREVVLAGWGRFELSGGGCVVVPTGSCVAV